MHAARCLCIDISFNSHWGTISHRYLEGHTCHVNIQNLSCHIECFALWGNCVSKKYKKQKGTNIVNVLCLFWVLLFRRQNGCRGLEVSWLQVWLKLKKTLEHTFHIIHLIVCSIFCPCQTPSSQSITKGLYIESFALMKKRLQKCYVGCKKKSAWLYLHFFIRHLVFSVIRNLPAAPLKTLSNFSFFTVLLSTNRKPIYML